jgi:hypothetical protein
VVPVDWEEHDDTSWWIALRCGECGSAREAIVSDEEADCFDQELDVGARQLEVLADRLEQERMYAETHAFAVALERDLIDAADFEPRG